MKKLLCIMVCLLTVISLSAQLIKGKTDKIQYMVGDPITYTFSVPLTNKSLNFSSEFQFSDTIQLVNTNIDTAKNMIKYTYTFVSFVEGTHTLPEFQFYEVNKISPVWVVQSPSIDIFLPVVDTTNIAVKPLKDIMKVPLTLREIIPFTLIGIVLVGIIIFIIYFFRHKDRRPKVLKSKPAIVIPEDEEALKNLNKLKQAHLLEIGQEKQHYVLLSEILWQYIYRRFDVNAFEMTTESIMGNMKNKDLEQEDKSKLNNIFSVADLVKFAKYIPDVRTNQVVLRDAEEFVKATKRIIIEEKNIVIEQINNNSKNEKSVVMKGKEVENE